MKTLKTCYVHVVVMSVPVDKQYTYHWQFTHILAQKGMRVWVPFGQTRRVALVMGVSKSCDVSYDIKNVCDILDEEPLYSVAWWHFFERMKHYYVTIDATLWACVCTWCSKEEMRQYRCIDMDALLVMDEPLAAFFQHRKIRTMQAIHKTIDAAWVRVRKACQLGALVAVYPILPTQKCVASSSLTLTTAQQCAVDTICNSKGFSPFLLYGVTGSGKTEVYLRAIESWVKNGRQVVVIVPEIGLIPQWLNALKQRVSCVGQWHSGMSSKQRLAVRLNLAQVDVLIGTRSALFLPLPRLAMLVVDEEHDASLKQQEGLRYSARDMAVLLAQTLKLPIVLGSATPSLESWHQAKEGQYQMLRLGDRIRDHVFVQPEIVDLRHQREPLHARLLQAVEEAHGHGEQSMLYLNRRGYAPCLYCCDCADIVLCDWCSTSLTLHKKQNHLRCHSCGFSKKIPNVCPVCQSDELKPLGVGTERVMQQLQEALPTLKVELLDRDRVSSEALLNDVLQRFGDGQIDCLVGTQMLVKGHHFPNVTLVGVVHADLGLNMPDFRATERWWQQLTQVLGRTGRGESAGRVLIQTLQPEGEWFQTLGDVHATEVLDQSLSQRKQFSYPPFARWVRIVFSAVFAADALQAAHDCYHYIEKQAWSLDLNEPMPCVFERKIGRFRYEVILRDPSRRVLPWCLHCLLEDVPLSSKVRRIIDVDPLDMM